MFPSKSFIVSGLTLGSSIHFEFIFVYGVRKCSNFILLHVAVQFSQHHLLKRPSFLHCILLFPLSKIRCPYVCGFISGLFILSHWSLFLFLCQYLTVLMCAKSLQSCPTLWLFGLQLPRLLCPWDSPGKSTGVGFHAFLQGISPTQVSNPGSLISTCTGKQVLYY